MCLIDKWIRVNSNKKIDEDGKIAKSGIANKKILKLTNKSKVRPVIRQNIIKYKGKFLER